MISLIRQHQQYVVLMMFGGVGDGTGGLMMRVHRQKLVQRDWHVQIQERDQYHSLLRNRHVLLRVMKLIMMQRLYVLQ